MRDTRWLAVLDDNTAIFGTPTIVKSALDRYLSSSVADGALVKQLSDIEAGCELLEHSDDAWRGADAAFACGSAG